MTYNEKFKEIATKGGQLKYVFGSLAQANLLVDKIYKQASGVHISIVIQPTDGRVTVYPNAKDEQHLLAGYAENIPLDYDAEVVQTKIESLKDEAFAMLGRLNASGYFEPVEDADYTVMFDALDANMVIVLMDFRLKEIEGRCI